jgi:hypothetical protein
MPTKHRTGWSKTKYGNHYEHELHNAAGMRLASVYTWGDKYRFEVFKRGGGHAGGSANTLKEAKRLTVASLKYVNR